MDGWVFDLGFWLASVLPQLIVLAAVLWGLWLLVARLRKRPVVWSWQWAIDHAIKIFVPAWLILSGVAVWVVMQLADPCAGTTRVCPPVQWIRPGYLAEDFRNLLWAASLVFGGAGAGAALINALRRTRLMQAEHALAQRGQDAETFSRAVEQLGSEQTAIRLGAIYALEGLMRSAFAEGGDKIFGRQIGETLAAFVREQSVPMAQIVSEWDAEAQKAEQSALASRGASVRSESSEGRIFKNYRLNVDLEAAVVVISRSWPHEHRPELDGDGGVDLSWSCLFRLRMPAKADMRGFNLVRADLRGCKFDSVDLRGAWLFEADFRLAQIRGADISSTVFYVPSAAVSEPSVTSKQINLARWRLGEPPILPPEVDLPHRGDEQPIGDPSPFDESWMKNVGSESE
ncbi:pentapeptide repeat-containing protein [Glycocaulis sp.]|uniref:pentapeptide repeat-containing protein n=1 Tax=Glycocaulis sp. TaxID=1969725 RepID=UPI003F72BADE